MRVECVEHPQDRCLGRFVQIELTGEMVFGDQDGISEVGADSLSGSRIVVTESLTRMGAGKCNRDNKGDNQEPVSIFEFHLMVLPLNPTSGEPRESDTSPTHSS